MPQGAALRQRSGNAPDRSAGPGVRKQSKACKRKQGDLEEDGGRENEPPQKKQPGGGSVKVRPGSKAQTKKKLIAGQGKLTSFFRL